MGAESLHERSNRLGALHATHRQSREPKRFPDHHTAYLSGHIWREHDDAPWRCGTCDHKLTDYACRLGHVEIERP